MKDNMLENKEQQERALLVALDTGEYDAEASLVELAELPEEEREVAAAEALEYEKARAGCRHLPGLRHGGGGERLDSAGTAGLGHL